MTDGRKVMLENGEARTHERAVQLLRRDYPYVIFRTDFAAGIKLPPWLARRQKLLQWGKGYPDLTILQPAKPAGYSSFCHGLFIEIKAAGVKLKLRDGRWAEPHFEAQFKVLQMLHDRGYAVAFAVGDEQIKAVLEWYLSGTSDLDFDEGFIPIIRRHEVIESELF